MANRAKADPIEPPSELAALAAEVRRLSGVVALAIVKDLPQKNQIGFLSNVGFSNEEVAAMVGTTRHTVAQTLHTIRKEKGRARRGSNAR